MKERRIKGLDQVITELRNKLVRTRYLSDYYDIFDADKNTVQIGVQVFWRELIKWGDYPNGLPTFANEVVSIEIHSASVFKNDDDPEEFLLDEKQLELLCKDLCANNVMREQYEG